MIRDDIGLHFSLRNILRM